MTQRNWKAICAVILAVNVGSAWAQEKAAEKPTLLPMPAPVPCPIFAAVPPPADLQGLALGLNTQLLGIPNEADAASYLIKVKNVGKRREYVLCELQTANVECGRTASFHPPLTQAEGAFHVDLRLRIAAVVDGMALVELTYSTNETDTVAWDGSGVCASRVTQVRKICIDGEPCRLVIAHDSEGNSIKWIEVALTSAQKPVQKVLQSVRMDSGHDEESQAASDLPEPMCMPTQAPPLATEPSVPPTFVPTGWFTPAGSSVAYPVPAPSKLPPPRGVSKAACLPPPLEALESSFTSTQQSITTKMATGSVPGFSIRADHDNRVLISTLKMTATADQIDLSENAGVLLLQGNVQVRTKDNSANIHVSEGQVAIHLVSGQVEILPAQR
jgi:hypothetical protein